jgi:hypothetical protein
MLANSSLRISFKKKKWLKWKRIGTSRTDMKLDRNSSIVMNKIFNWKKKLVLKRTIKRLNQLRQT